MNGWCNMFIDRAIFRNGTEEEIVTLESITHHENYLLVKENLYCAISNCNCRLIYVPEGLKVAYFKKWKGDNHNEDCPFYKETIKDAKSIRISGKTVSRLRDDHINKVLKDTFIKFNETEEEKKERLRRQNQKYRTRKNKVIERQATLEFEDIIVNLPTTSLEANEIREGERNPTVRKRLSILDFEFSDIGLTLSTIGFLDNLTIGEKYSTIVITDDYNRLTFTIFLEEVFYANSTFAINSMLQGLERLFSSPEEIIVACVGEVVFREGQFGMLVIKEDNLSFNGQYLSNLLLSKNTLF